MAKLRSKAPSARLGVPELFVRGGFEQVLILTYSADLEFYERALRRHFGGFRNQIVLADDRHLDRSIRAAAVSQSLRHLNRSWIAGPIRARHSAHAKAVLLAGPEAGLLLVGSGNLNLLGYAGAGECFTPFRWNPEENEALAAFTSVRALTDGLAARGHVDDITVERLGVFWAAYDWWHAEPGADGPVRHNLDQALAQQFIDAIGGKRVQELTVVAPFHDTKCAALDRLASQLRPQRLRVLVQPGACSVDPKRLAAVLRKHGGEVHTIEAAGEHAAAYLHAKILIATTSDRSVALTGSANCSTVALWSDQPDANLELGVLAVGARGEFDHLLAPETVTVAGPVDPATLDLHLQEDEDPEAESGRAHVVDVQLRGRTLRGKIHADAVSAEDIVIEVNGTAVTGIMRVEPAGDGVWAFAIEIDDDDLLADVEGVAVLMVRIADAAVAAVVPYQLDKLREQDGRRLDAERLRHAAGLELEDPDLEQALAALEEILIGDNVSRWTRGRDVAPPSESDGTSIAWDQIDWAAVRRNPRYAAYGGLQGGAAAGSALADYLAALGRLVRELLDPEGGDAEAPAAASGVPGTQEDDDEEPDESDLSSGVEGAEPDDLDEEPPLDPRRQSPAQRNRRLIRNFVRRNLTVLEQQGFRDGVGAGIVIPNVIILNWVCWWVATKDADVEPQLIDERLRLWTLLWGAGTEPGYLDTLDDELLPLVRERFEAQAFEAVTTASIADVWAGIPTVTDPEYRRLRAVVRRAVIHPSLRVSADVPQDAAVLANKRPTAVEPIDAYEIANRLWDAACASHGDHDVRTAVAAAARCAVRDTSMEVVAMIVDGKADQRSVPQLLVNARIVPGHAVEALAAWRGSADLPHYRLKWRDGVAFYNAELERGWVVPDDGDELNIGELQPAYPPWRIAIDQLIDDLDELAAAVA